MAPGRTGPSSTGLVSRPGPGCFNLKCLRGDVKEAKVAKPSPAYDPKSPAHTASELHRYIRATQRMQRLQNQFISMAGPDSTKVGTDFSCSMGYLYNPGTKKAAVLAPQAVSFSLVAADSNRNVHILQPYTHINIHIHLCLRSLAPAIPTPNLYST